MLTYPNSKLYSIFAVANLLTYCGQISLQSAAVKTAIFLTNRHLWGITFTLLAIVPLINLQKKNWKITSDTFNLKFSF